MLDYIQKPKFQEIFRKNLKKELLLEGYHPEFAESEVNSMNSNDITQIIESEYLSELKYGNEYYVLEFSRKGSTFPLIKKRKN